MSDNTITNTDRNMKKPKVKVTVITISNPNLKDSMKPRFDLMALAACCGSKTKSDDFEQEKPSSKKSTSDDCSGFKMQSLRLTNLSNLSISEESSGVIKVWTTGKTCIQNKNLTPDSPGQRTISTSTSTNTVVGKFIEQQSSLKSENSIRRKKAERYDREMCLVFLLVAITIFFCITAFPSALIKIIQSIKGEFRKQFNVYRSISDTLEVSGHVFNFCLYFMLSPDFRLTLFSLPKHVANKFRSSLRK